MPRLEHELTALALGIFGTTRIVLLVVLCSAPGTSHPAMIAGATASPRTGGASGAPRGVSAAALHLRSHRSRPLLEEEDWEGARRGGRGAQRGQGHGGEWRRDEAAPSLPGLCLRGGGDGVALCPPPLFTSLSVSDRMKALWAFKDEAKAAGQRGEGAKVVKAAGQWLRDPSVLVRHEVCYVVGQSCGDEAVDFLSEVLSDEAEDSMVRHEAAEALGAVGSARGVEALQSHVLDAKLEVSETCRLAIDRLQWLRSGGGTMSRDGPFSSIDPAPSLGADDDAEVHALGKVLCDDGVPLFDRYRAMFGLRDSGTDTAVSYLSAALQRRGGQVAAGALLRHEVAFVMGQLATKSCRPSLEAALSDCVEHPMVRHEAAEALGAQGHDGVRRILERFKDDSCAVVADSCVVALDMLDYWSKFRMQEDAL